MLLRAPLAAACLCLYSFSAHAADECGTPLLDESYQALQCAQTSLAERQATMQTRYKALRHDLEQDEAESLERDQTQWASFVDTDCTIYTEMAGRDNDAWRITWGEVAMLACRADMTAAREERLGQYQALIKRRSDQKAAILAP